MSRSRNNEPGSEYGASIGMVLRDWRQTRGRSRAWLAQRSGVSAQRLARLERGELCPDEATVTALIAALNETPGRFYAETSEAFQQRVRLQGLLEDLGLPSEYWGDFLELDAAARDAFIRSIERRIPSQARRRDRLQAIEDAIVRDGLEPSIPLIFAGIEEYGLTPADHFRASVELEEMPGNRSVFTDRLPFSPVAVPVDQLYLFRASYGLDLPDPMLLKWWAESRRSAMNANLEDYQSRTIISLDRLETYILTGERAPTVTLQPETVISHLVAIIELLRTKPRFLLGLVSANLPLTYRVKGDHHVLTTIYGPGTVKGATLSRTTLLFSRREVVARFNEHFERMWAAIPEERRDGKAVANWLESQLSRIA